MRLCLFVFGMLFSTFTFATGKIWLVQVDINKVSENNLKVATAETTEPTPTTRSFGYKFYLYEAADGSVSLLPTSGIFYDKRSGADTECAEVEVVDGMRLYLELNTTEFYKGCHLRTIINASIPYDGDRGDIPTALVGIGSIAEGGSVLLSPRLDKSHPVNPFRHIYHPDHGLGRDIGRSLTFSEFAPIPGQNNTFSATINEEVSGLQRIDIKSSGEATFIQIHENVELGLGATS